MFKTLFFLLFLTSLLNSKNILKESYYFDDHTIKCTNLVDECSIDFVVLTIPSYKTKMLIKPDQILKEFKKNAISIEYDSNKYITFIKKSHFDSVALEIEVAKYYRSKYKTIDINSISITPRAYTQQIPMGYKLHLSSKSYKRDSGTFYISSSDKDRIFFDYKIDATLKVLVATQEIKRHEQLSSSNTEHKNVKFEKIRSKPFEHEDITKFQVKNKITQGSIIEEDDLTSYDLVLRDDRVIAILKSENLYIEFEAKALKNGALNDTITIIKDDGQRVRAKVVDVGKVEVQ